MESGGSATCDIIEATGVAITKQHWLRFLQGDHGGVAPSRLRVALLDPEGDAAAEGPRLGLVWWTDVAAVRAKILGAAASLTDFCAGQGIELDLRFYDQIPVSRYVGADWTVYQSGFPLPGDFGRMSVAVLAAGSVLAERAAREFTVLWTGARDSGSTPGRSAGCVGGQVDRQSSTTAGTLTVAHDDLRVIAHRKLVPADIARCASPGLHSVDVIDVAGTAQVSAEWWDVMRERRGNGCGMRILLLDPDGAAARARAQESTFWQGDDGALRAKVHRNVDRLLQQASDAGWLAEVRFYDSLPVSRYVRVDSLVYQSYYPSTGSARDIPVVVLAAESMLGQRAQREFDVLWRTRSRPAGREPLSTKLAI